MALNLGIPFELVNPSASSGGGGGGGPPTITADTTINVPSDQPTIAAALNYVRARVVLNGAVVTINVQSALIPTLNEQITIENEYLPFVKITNDGPINVNATGFVPVGFPIPVWFLVNAGEFGELSGSWTKTVGNAVGVGVINSGMLNVGNATSSTLVTGFTFFDIVGYLNGSCLLQGVTTAQIGAAEASRLVMSGGTLTGSAQSTFASLLRMGSVQVNKTTTGRLFYADAGSTLEYDNPAGTINMTVANMPGVAKAERSSKIFIHAQNYVLDASAGFSDLQFFALDGSFIDVFQGFFTYPSVANNQIFATARNANIRLRGVQSPSASAVAVLFAEQNGTIDSYLGAWHLDSGWFYYTTSGGHINVFDDGVDVSGGSAAGLATATEGGTMSINASASGAPSIGARFNVAQGAIIQSRGSITVADFTAGDSQAHLTVTANGLIISS